MLINTSEITKKSDALVNSLAYKNKDLNNDKTTYMVKWEFVECTWWRDTEVLSAGKRKKPWIYGSANWYC